MFKFLSNLTEFEWRLFNRFEASFLFQKPDLCPFKFGKTEDQVIPRNDIFVPYHKDRKSNKTTDYRIICRKELNDWETRRSKLVFKLKMSTEEIHNEGESGLEATNTHVQGNVSLSILQ